MLRVALVSLALAAAVLRPSSALHFYLHAAERRCFSQTAAPNVRILTEYTVSTGTGTMPVDLTVTALHDNKQLYTQKNVEHGKFAFVVPYDDAKQPPHVQHAEVHRHHHAHGDHGHQQHHDYPRHDSYHHTDAYHSHQQDHQGHDAHQQEHHETHHDGAHRRRLLSVSDGDSHHYEHHDDHRDTHQDDWKHDHGHQDRGHDTQRDAPHDEHHYEHHDERRDGRHDEHRDTNRDSYSHERQNDNHHGEHYQEHHNEHGHDERRHDEHRHDEHGHIEHAHEEHAHEEHGHDEHGHDERHINTEEVKKHQGEVGDMQDDPEDMDFDDEYDGLDDDELEHEESRIKSEHVKQHGERSEGDEEGREEELFEERKFEVCFSNSDHGDGADRRRVKLVVRKGAEAHDYQRLAKREHMSQLEVALKRISDELHQLMVELEQARAMERVLQMRNEGTNSRVVFLAVTSLVVLLGVGGGQAMYTKRFLKRKKIL